jgi:hypothetical protein
MANTLTTNQFIDKSKLIHGDEYDYSLINYVNSRTKIKIICRKHGVFEQKADSHLTGHKCSKCSIINKSLTQHQFINKSIAIHGKKYDYSESIYVNTKTKIKIKCYKHGIFEQEAGEHLRGSGCGICKESKGEKRIRVFLEKHNIFYKNQHSFEDCRNPNTNRKLKFDFYLPEKNLIIEFDGIQHFDEGVGGILGGTHAATLSEVKSNQYRDALKNKYLSDKKIDILRIKYTELSKIHEILKSKLVEGA